MARWSITYLKAIEELLNSKKELFIDPTLGNYSFTFPNVRPIDIRMLKDIAEPQNFRTPHYHFYENNRGFHFRTLESLYRESGDSTQNRPFVAYIDLLSAFNPNFSVADADVDSPITKPYSFSFNESYNTLLNTRKGLFGNDFCT